MSTQTKNSKSMLAKKPIQKFKGSIVMGLFVPDEQEPWKHHVATLEGKDVEVICKKYRAYKQRSKNENAYYWGVVVKILADEWGYDCTIESEKLRVHDTIKSELLSEAKEFIRKDGKKKIIMVPGSTATQDTCDFENLMSRIRRWANMEFQIYIPLPNEPPFDYL